MRKGKVAFSGNLSLDGYLARPDGAVDWLLSNDDNGDLIIQWWRRFSSLLIGRKTYEFLAQHGGGPIKRFPTYVFSRTLREIKANGIELVTADAADFVRQLKVTEGRDICLLGGGDFAKTLFEAGLIDEIWFTIHPVLLGAGVPAFLPMAQQIDLELLEQRVFQTGCVSVTYRVKYCV